MVFIRVMVLTYVLVLSCVMLSAHAMVLSSVMMLACVKVLTHVNVLACVMVLDHVNVLTRFMVLAVNFCYGAACVMVLSVSPFCVDSQCYAVSLFYGVRMCYGVILCYGGNSYHTAQLSPSQTLTSKGRLNNVKIKMGTICS